MRLKKVLGLSSAAQDVAGGGSRGRRVLKAVHKERESAQKERAILSVRMEACLRAAAFALDSADDWGRRNPADERNISRLEASAQTARSQLDELQDEIELLGCVERTLSR